MDSTNCNLLRARPVRKWRRTGIGNGALFRAPSGFNSWLRPGFTRAPVADPFADAGSNLRRRSS
jgi:hypothetical protein